MVHTYAAPPGWPRPVPPPGLPGWEERAEAWLLDITPPEFRTQPAVRGHLVVLARFAVLHVEASQAACARGLSEARGDLAQFLDHDAIEAAIQAWHAESARLLGLRRAVGLVEDAVRGARYRPKL